MSGSATDRRKRVTSLRAALPCLALSLIASPLKGQTLTSDLLRPASDGFLTAQDSPLRRTSEVSPDNPAAPAANGQPTDKNQPAPSRIGNIPKYGLPAASGASEAGFDSLNRK